MWVLLAPLLSFAVICRMSWMKQGATASRVNVHLYMTSSLGFSDSRITVLDAVGSRRSFCGRLFRGESMSVEVEARVAAGITDVRLMVAQTRKQEFLIASHAWSL
jgi:hypothetical protein